jgi:hypothetical protein
VEDKLCTFFRGTTDNVCVYVPHEPDVREDQREVNKLGGCPQPAKVVCNFPYKGRVVLIVPYAIVIIKVSIGCIAKENEIIHPLEKTFNPLKVEDGNNGVCDMAKDAREAGATKTADMINVDCAVLNQDAEEGPILRGKWDSAEGRVDIEDCSLCARRCIGSKTIAMVK